MPLIASTSALEAFCLAATQSDFITVDTEFLRERTYFPQLCVVQVASAAGVAVIDALDTSLDLTPLWDLLYNPALPKVFHAARQDVEILVHLHGKVPENLIDTQVAAALCGFRDSIGYDKLVKALLGVELDKTCQYSDWTQRPLSARHIDYAAQDVTHLRLVYEKLRATLARKGRLEWLTQEMATFANLDFYRTHPNDAWQRLKLPQNTRTNARQRAYFLAIWREEQAQRLNLPRGHILNDEGLLKIAGSGTVKPATVRAALNQTQGALTENLCAFLQNPPPYSFPTLENSQTAPIDVNSCAPAPLALTTDLLRVLLKFCAAEAGVPEKMVANSEQLEILAREAEKATVFALKGWRWEVFGRQALALLSGTMQLQVGGKHGVVVSDTVF